MRGIFLSNYMGNLNSRDIWTEHWHYFDVSRLVREIKGRDVKTVQTYNRFKEIEFLGKFSKNKSVTNVCDFGSGMGIANVVWSKEVSCILVDNSSEALSCAREFHDNFKSCKVSTIKKSILEDFVEFKEKFDVTWNQGVLEHFYFRGQIKIIENMANITKSGGYVVIMVPNSMSTHSLIVKAFDILRLFGHKGWCKGYEKPMSFKELKNLISYEKRLKVVGIRGIVPFVSALPFKNDFLNKIQITLAKKLEGNIIANRFGRELVVYAKKI